MEHLIITFKGIPDNKELTAETFTTTEKNWNYLKSFKFNRPVLTIEGYKHPININDVFANCEVVLKTIDCPTYLNSKKTLTFITKFMQSQRSRLDEYLY